MVLDPRRQRRILSSALSRRKLLQRSAAAGGAAMLAAASPRGRSAFAQEIEIDTSVSGPFALWGFGAEETNPLGFLRLQAFLETFPDVELEHVPVIDDQRILTGVASGEVPDVLWLDRASTPTWVARGDVLMPLDDFIAEDGFDMSMFYDAAVAEVTYEDAIYGIPQFMDVRALYVNLDILEEAGIDPASIDTSNWEQLNELGPQLIVRDGDVVQRWGYDNKVPDGHLYTWGVGNGGTFLSEDGETVMYNDPAIVEALELSVATYEMQGGFEDYAAVKSTWQGDEQFARGQVAITAYEHWMMGIIGRVAPELNFTVLPIRERGGEGYVSYTGGSSWTIPSGAESPEIAWEFIKFMNRQETWQIGAEGEKQLREENGEIWRPTLTANMAIDQFLINELYEPTNQAFDEAVALFPQILEQSFTRPYSRSPVGAELNDILNNEAVQPTLLGETTAQEGLDEANAQAQEAIDDFE